MNKKGDSKKGSKERAAQMCMEAAKQGHLAAQYHLGRVYGFGIGVGKDYRKALECYRKAEEMGHPLAGNKRARLEEVIEKLKDFVDVYLVDLKYMSNELSQKYSKANNYVEAATTAIKQMKQNDKCY